MGILLHKLSKRLGKWLNENNGTDDIDANTENSIYMSKILSKIINKWDAENEGKPVLPTQEFFGNAIIDASDLFTFTMTALAPKTTDETSEDFTFQAEK